jgi:hypothetical protein
LVAYDLLGEGELVGGEERGAEGGELVEEAAEGLWCVCVCVCVCAGGRCVKRVWGNGALV